MINVKELNNFMNSYFKKEIIPIFPAFKYSFCKTGFFNQKTIT